MNTRCLSRTPTALAATLLSLSLLSPAMAQTDERAELEQLRATTMALMQALIDAGLLSREKADAIVRQAQQAHPASTAQAAAGPAKPASNVVRVPYISESTKAELRAQIKADVMDEARTERWAAPNVLPEWFSRLTIEGDVRARLEKDNFAASNYPGEYYLDAASASLSPTWAPDLANTTNDRTRTTLRARLGVSGQLGDTVSAGVRLATGSLANGATSTSQTLGNGFNRYTIGLDRGWIKWTPAQGVELNAGRFASPFFGTDLTWPDDLNFDGVALGVHRDWGGSHNKAFATVGAFPLQEFSVGADANKWLYGAQIGAQFKLAEQTRFKIGLAMYDFNGIEGVQESAYQSGSLARSSNYLSTKYPADWRQKGNTLININPVNDPTFPGGDAVYGLASKFRPIDLTMMLSFHQFDPIAVQLSFDYLKNTAWDINDIRRRAVDDTIDLEGKTSAMQLRVNVGRTSIERAGDWQASFALRRLERDAWVDAFTDTTWNLGGTNYQGWSLGLQYGVADRTSLGLRWTSTRNLKDSTADTTSATLSSAPFKLNVFQVELNARF